MAEFKAKARYCRRKQQAQESNQGKVILRWVVDFFPSKRNIRLKPCTPLSIAFCMSVLLLFEFSTVPISSVCKTYNCIYANVNVNPIRHLAIMHLNSQSCTTMDHSLCLKGFLCRDISKHCSFLSAEFGALLN